MGPGSGCWALGRRGGGCDFIPTPESRDHSDLSGTLVAVMPCSATSDYRGVGDPGQ